MQILFSYCYQTCAYGDSHGECVVLLENNETIKDVIKDFVNAELSNPFETRYSNAKPISTYTHYNRTFTGNLVLLDTLELYCD